MTDNEIKFPDITNLSEQWQFFNKAIQSFNKFTLEIKDQPWDYWRYGTGDKALILFHGAMIGPEMFFYPTYTLSEKYKIIIPFIPDNLSNTNDLIAAFNVFIKQENINHVTILGYSYGGGLVQALLDFIPEKIDRAVLSHTGMLWGREKPKSMKVLKLLIKLIPLSVLKKALLKKRMQEYPNAPWNDFYQEYFSGRMNNLKKITLFRYLSTANEFLKNYQLNEPKERRYKGTVILLGTIGDEDTYHHFDAFQKIFPDALEHVFSESGGHHFIFLNPKKYTAELYKLLRSTE